MIQRKAPDMPSIALITVHARYPWLRQMPGEDLLPEGWHVTLNTVAEDCALVVVYDDPGKPFRTGMPKARRIVILSEPPGITTYRKGFLEQFGVVYGPIKPEGHSGRWIATQPALPWFFGVGFGKDGLITNLDADAIAALPPPPKARALSVVISGKTQLPKHRARLALVEALKARLGDRLHVFGRGFQDIDDKADAILPYAYHLVLENNDIPHFWTEKTADAYLGWAYPIFSGCSNLSQYMPEDSFTPIDIEQPEQAIATILQVLDTDPWEQRLPEIAEARRRILFEHNVFAVLGKLAGEFGDTVPAGGTPKTVYGQRDLTFKARVRALLQRVLGSG